MEFVQLLFELLASIGWRYHRQKKCSSNQLIKWSDSDTPTVQVFVSTAINPKYALFVCFLEYNSKYQNQEVGSLALEHYCIAIAAKWWQEE